jgi:hypothetical protein
MVRTLRAPLIRAPAQHGLEWRPEMTVGWLAGLLAFQIVDVRVLEKLDRTAWRSSRRMSVAKTRRESAWYTAPMRAQSASLGLPVIRF